MKYFFHLCYDLINKLDCLLIDQGENGNVAILVFPLFSLLGY